MNNPRYLYSLSGLSQEPIEHYQRVYQRQLLQHRYGGELVHQVEPGTFDEFVTMHPNKNIIVFHSPTCLHCKELEPTYAILAQQLSKTQPEFCVAAMDCSEANQFADTHNIQGFPTVRMYKKPKSFKEFKSADRNLKNLHSFIQRRYK